MNTLCEIEVELNETFLNQEANIDEDVWNELALLHEKLNPAKVS